MKLLDTAGCPPWVSSSMPHPIQQTAEGRHVYNINMMTWSDDVSGNRTKQYNAHTNVYLANLNLPHKLLQQEYFVRFCSTSPEASALEQFDALCSDLYVDVLLMSLFRSLIRLDTVERINGTKRTTVC